MLRTAIGSGRRAAHAGGGARLRPSARRTLSPWAVPRLPAVHSLDALPAVQALGRVGRTAPVIPAYDEYLKSRGGDLSATF